MSNFLDYIKERSIRAKMVFMLILSFIFFITGIYNFMLFHLVVELFSVFVAFSIFMLVFYSKDRIENNYLIFLGAAFLFIGGFDFVHTLFYKGMEIFDYSKSNLPTQLWIISRYIEAFSLLGAVYLIGKKKKINLNNLLIFYSFISGVLILSLFMGIFPDCYIEGVGLTPFKKISEYIISAVLLSALFITYKKKKRMNPKIYELLLVSVTITIISEISFTFYNSVYGTANIIGHILKFISFYLIYELMLKKIILEPQKFLFDELKESKEKWELAAESANLGIWELDLENNELFFDENCAEMLGYKYGQLEQSVEEIKNLIYDEDLEKIKNNTEEFLESRTKYFNLEYRIKNSSGNFQWISNTGQILERNEHGQPVKLLGTHQDIDIIKKSQKKLKYLSFHDELTGLYNRRYFENEMERLNDSRKYPISVIVGDIDNLKEVNDLMGHKAGDKYIKKVADVFQKYLRSEDIVARIGGDEIAVILPDADEKTAEMICSRIEEKSKDINSDEEYQLLFRVSMGHHTVSSSSEDLEHAFAEADKKMYENKNSFKNNCLHEDLN